MTVRLLSRLLLLVSLLLMPLGMIPAHAAASHDHMSAEMPMGHCPDQDSDQSDKRGFAECTMACAAGLPAAEGRAEAPVIIDSDRAMPAAVHRLHGLHPETATPPPKLS